MTYIPDLSPCEYFGPIPGLIAIGWLDAPHPYAKGKAPEGLLDQLGGLLADPWNPSLFWGIHTCTLCEKGKWWWLPPEHNELELGMTNLWIPGPAEIFVSPSLIIHYVHNHGYLPPQEFVEALFRCPTMKSPEYFSALLQAGSPELRELIASSRDW